MTFSKKTPVNILVGLILTAAGGATGAQAACEDLVGAFNRAIASRSVEAANRALADINNDIVCGTLVDEFRGKFAEFLVTSAETAGTAAADRERFTLMAQRLLETNANWQVAERLADHFMGHGDKVSAHRWYEKSVSALAKLVGANANERHALLMKLAAAKSLANDDKEGKKTAVSYEPTTREPDGSAGGLYSKALLRAPRAVDVVGVPVPINFYTNETRFTPLGEQALQELAEVIKAERVLTMRLVGHADPRGTPQYNMDLSRRRVEAVRDALLRQGITARIVTDWKGAQKPFDVGVLPFRPSQEEIWQLDRRVEWEREALPE
jgi:outer membrane protein OmpA-like peptidoglycan-associated protein